MGGEICSVETKRQRTKLLVKPQKTAQAMVRLKQNVLRLKLQKAVAHQEHQALSLVQKALANS